MGRPTSVEEVAELVAFLASPAGHLMTGQLIQLDGAAHLGPGLHMMAA
jgi:citronellol/citronellal dehydrogenase